jgi:hypothetical protein
MQYLVCAQDKQIGIGVVSEHKLTAWLLGEINKNNEQLLESQLFFNFMDILFALLTVNEFKI